MNKMILKHNDPNCPCEYCIILRKYIQARKDLTRFRREYWNDSYTGWAPLSEEFINANEQYLYYRLTSVEYDVKYLKFTKDRLKELSLFKG